YRFSQRWFSQTHSLQGDGANRPKRRLCKTQPFRQTHAQVSRHRNNLRVRCVIRAGASHAISRTKVGHVLGALNDDSGGAVTNSVRLIKLVAYAFKRLRDAFSFHLLPNFSDQLRSLTSFT